MRAYLAILLFVILPYKSLWAAGPPVTAEDRKVDSLFVMASSGELEFRDLVAPAIDSIAAMGTAAIPRLIEKCDSRNARERHTLNTIFVKIGRPAVPYLIRTIPGRPAEEVSRICSTLGEIKDSSAVEGLMEVATHDDWRVRSAVTGALGDINDKRANAVVARALADSNELVRKSAAVSAGKLSIDDAMPALVHLLGDDFYGARFCASEALVKFGPKAIKVITDSLKSNNDLVGNLGCTTLGVIGGDSSGAILVAQLDSRSSLRRALAVEGIMLSNSSSACGAVEILSKTENDPVVLFYIDKTIRKYDSR